MSPLRPVRHSVSARFHRDGDRTMGVATYTASPARTTWLVDRRDELRAIEEAHRRVAQASPGPGRPLSRGGDQIARAFIVRLYAEFQGFARDLHDLAVLALLDGSRIPPGHQLPVMRAVVDGRRLDRGNAGLRELTQDFRRIGLEDLGTHLAALNARHASDRSRYDRLTRLRNALAHGNDLQLAELATAGVRPTLTEGRRTLPALNRIARALDRAVWNHVSDRYPAIEPWSSP